ncbi:hypothetical protein ACFC8F_00540 [Streptomyces hydrogenans]|uniref:hypothetical protein n=1 Tax=Streptomyces TaxID=1883 RepID=UPI0035DB05B3
MGMYGFRHRFASNALGNGIPITDVAERMGHKSIEVAGALITGALLALSQAELPEVATGPLVALIITAVLAGVHQGRLPGYHDLIDIIRGADRR